MVELSVSLSGLLWAIGAGVLTSAFRPKGWAKPQPGEPKYPGASSVDWWSGLGLMLSFSLLGTSATALWFRFADPLKSFLFFVFALTVIFAQAVLFWFLIKRAANRQEPTGGRQ